MSMDPAKMDNLSIKSSSDSMSDEFEIVPEHVIPSNNNNLLGGGGFFSQKLSSDPDHFYVTPPVATTTSPTLNIANNGDLQDLKKNLDEMIHEIDKSAGDHRPPSAETSSDAVQLRNNLRLDDLNRKGVKDGESGEAKRKSAVNEDNRAEQRQSATFYVNVDPSPVTTTTEKQDDMKPADSSDTEEDMSDIDQECTIFAGVTYLGSVNVNAPKSNMEIQRKMSELNGISDAVGLKVTVSIPNCSGGVVVLHDVSTAQVVAHYEVNRILFYARGTIGTPDQACFAFSWSHGDSQESAIFQCHVFRCHIPEAVTQVSACFARAFQRIPAQIPSSMTASMIDSASVKMEGSTTTLETAPGLEVFSAVEYEFVVSLEIKEKLTKTSNSYCAVPRDKSKFKLRAHCNKEILISVQQAQTPNQSLLHIERCFGVLLSPGKLVRHADMHLLDMVTMGYVNVQGGSIPAYQVLAGWKATDKFLDPLNVESQNTDITVAVDLVIKGIQEPVRFIIETVVQIQPPNELRIMDQFFYSNANNQKRSLVVKFYLNLKELDDGGWEVNSIDPTGEQPSPLVPTNPSIFQMGINNISKMVRSQSATSIEQEELNSPTDYSSDGDEPMLSGTGEVSRDCSQDALEDWNIILVEWQTTKRPKSLSNLVRAGIPEALRGKVWQKLADVEERQDLIDYYKVLITQETSCETVIQRDINRTFPAHKFFRDSGGFGQESLYKVSKAYAVYDNEVGYCQGLSFVAASLLLHMPEEEAFCVLVALMYQYKLRDLYKDGFDCLYLRLFQLDCVLKDQVPKLFEHFQRVGVETHMFASQWFLTLFTARFPLYFVFHILDLVLLDGIQVLFQVAVTLLATFESELRQLDFEGILKFFRITLPKKCRSLSQAKKLLKGVSERKVKHLKKYEEKFQHKKELEEREEQEVQKYETMFGNERKKLQTEISMLEQKMTATVEASSQHDKVNAGIISDYKQIIQRQEQQIGKLNDMLQELSSLLCDQCASKIPSTSPLHETFAGKRSSIDSNKKVQDMDQSLPLGPLDPLNVANHRIRELELELAQTKLAQVEAECKNQDLNHQLNSTLTEIQSNRSSWQPWLSKTLNSIQEKVGPRKDGISSGQNVAHSKDSKENRNSGKYKEAVRSGSVDSASIATEKFESLSFDPPK